MFVRTKYPGLIVDTTIKELKDGRLRVTGKGINPESEVEYKEIPPYTTRPVSPKRLASAKAEVVSVLEESYFNTFSAHNLGEKAAEQAFYRVVQDVENGLRLKSAWKARSTNDNVIKYFDRNIKRLVFPYLNSGNAEFSETDRELVKSKLFDICMKSSGNREDVAKEMLAKHLAEADVILAHLCDYDQSLPLIRLSSGEQVQRAWRKEQVKMLPLHVLYKFYGMLWDWAEREPRKVFFAVLVIFGLRPAEAAGCKPESIIWFDTFCVVYIQQMEVDGVIVYRLKNKYSFRPVVISYWGMKLLEICCVAIGEDYPRDIRPMNSATECADWVKNLLFQAGAQEKDIREIASDLSNEDLDPQSIPRQHRIEEATKDKEVKIACYVLRRCACTIMRSEMGLSLYETDRLLGHIPVGLNGKKEAKTANVDFNSPEEQARVAMKMERFVFDERFTLNPGYNPYSMQEGDRQELIEYSEYEILNGTNEDLEISLNIEASEASEIICIQMAGNCEQDLSTISTPKTWEGKTRSVIGNTAKTIIKEERLKNE